LRVVSDALFKKAVSQVMPAMHVRPRPELLDNFNTTRSAGGRKHLHTHTVCARHIYIYIYIDVCGLIIHTYLCLDVCSAGGRKHLIAVSYTSSLRLHTLVAQGLIH
jgi:hypothetical protein